MCYTVPTLGAMVTSAAWLRTRNPKLGRLNLLFWGGAVFGIIDHLWNGELLAFSGNLASDLMLGVAITGVILAVWAGSILLEKYQPAGSASDRLTR